MPLANCCLLVGLRELKIVHSKIVDALFVWSLKACFFGALALLIRRMPNSIQKKISPNVPDNSRDFGALVRSLDVHDARGEYLQVDLFTATVLGGQQQGILILPDVWQLGYRIMLSGRKQITGLNSSIVVIAKWVTFLVVLLKNLRDKYVSISCFFYPAKTNSSRRCGSGSWIGLHTDPDPRHLLQLIRNATFLSPFHR